MIIALNGKVGSISLLASVDTDALGREGVREVMALMFCFSQNDDVWGPSCVTVAASSKVVVVFRFSSGGNSSAVAGGTALMLVFC